MVYYRWQNLDRLPIQGGLLLVLFSGYERSYPKIIKFREKKISQDHFFLFLLIIQSDLALFHAEFFLVNNDSS